ncbi:hypothetical protein L3Q82_016545, partial [Scortum barcoo]
KLGSTPSIPDSAIVPDGTLHSPTGPDNSFREEQGRRRLLHGEQQAVLRRGDYFYGLFSGPGAPHDQMPALLSSVSLREFTSVVMTAVYVPPHADTNKAMDELFGVIDRTETSGRRLRSLQKLKRDGPVTRTIQQWSDQSDSALHATASARRSGVFKDTEINTYTDAVIGYIGKCIDDIVPRITVRTFPNQKPWVNGEICAKLKARTDAYNSGDLEEYRKSRSMWAGLKTLTDYKKKISSAEVMSASLPDELNTFYARFESTSPAVEVQKAQEDHCPTCDIQDRRVQNSKTDEHTACVLSPLLYSLFTHDCVATHSSNTIIKFADDTTVIGLITGDDETAYRERLRRLNMDSKEPLQQLLQVTHREDPDWLHHRL